MRVCTDCVRAIILSFLFYLKAKSENQVGHYFLAIKLDCRRILLAFVAIADACFDLGHCNPGLSSIFDSIIIGICFFPVSGPIHVSCHAYGLLLMLLLPLCQCLQLGTAAVAVPDYDW